MKERLNQMTWISKWALIPKRWWWFEGIGKKLKLFRMHIFNHISNEKYSFCTSVENRESPVQKLIFQDFLDLEVYNPLLYLYACYEQWEDIRMREEKRRDTCGIPSLMKYLLSACQCFRIWCVFCFVLFPFLFCCDVLSLSLYSCFDYSLFMWLINWLIDHLCYCTLIWIFRYCKPPWVPFLKKKLEDRV